MQSLNQYIVEKLKLSKDMKKPFSINKEQFKTLCLYLATWFDHEELIEDFDGWVSWGELERSYEFSLDFYDKENSWISNVGCLELEGEEAAYMLDRFASPILDIFTELQKIYEHNPDRGKYNFRSILFYIMDYFIKFNNINKIDWHKLKEVTVKTSSGEIKYEYTDSYSHWFEIINQSNKTSKHIFELMNKAVDAAIDLME